MIARKLAVEWLEQRQMLIATPSPATAIWTSAGAKIDWTNVTGETQYAIQRAPANTTNWTWPPQYVTADTTTWTEPAANLTVGSSYIYQVSAIDASGWSGGAQTGPVTAQASVPSAPGTPSGAPNGSTVTVNWTASATFPAGSTYTLQRFRVDDGSWTQTNYTGLTSVSYPDTNVPTGGYQYKVLAVNSVGYAESSNSSTITVTGATAAAPAVTSLSANSATSVSIAWSAAVGGSGTQTYSLFRRVGNNNWNDSANTTTLVTGTTSLSYADNSTNSGTNAPVASTTYYYLVYAANGAANYQWSSGNDSVLTPTGSTATFAAPQAANANNAVRVSWGAYSGSVTQYYIQRFESNSSGTITNYTAQLNQTVPASSLFYDDTTASTTQLYVYKVNVSTPTWVNGNFTNPIQFSGGGGTGTPFNEVTGDNSSTSAANVSAFTAPITFGSTTGTTVNGNSGTGTTDHDYYKLNITGMGTSAGVIEISSNLASDKWSITPSDSGTTDAISIAGNNFNGRTRVRIKADEASTLYLHVQPGQGTYWVTVKVTGAQTAVSASVRKIAEGVNISNWLRFVRTRVDPNDPNSASEVKTDGTYISDQNLSDLLTAGVRSVRLAISPRWLLGGSDNPDTNPTTQNSDKWWNGSFSGTFNATEKDKISAVLNKLRGYVSPSGKSFSSIIVVFHGFELNHPSGKPSLLQADPSITQSTDSNVTQAMKDAEVSRAAQARSTFAALWKQFASDFMGTDGKIVYELLNEPKFSSSAAGRREWDLAQDAVISRIREADASGLIISTDSNVGSLNDTFLSTIRPSWQQNVIYSLHYYKVFQYSHQGALGLRYDRGVEGWFHDIPAPRNASEVTAARDRIDGFLGFGTMGQTQTQLAAYVPSAAQLTAFRDSYLKAKGWAVPTSTGVSTATADVNAFWDAGYGGTWNDPVSNTSNSGWSRLKVAWYTLRNYRYYFASTGVETQGQFAGSQFDGVVTEQNKWVVRSYLGEYGANKHEDYDGMNATDINMSSQRNSYLQAVADAAYARKIPACIWGYDDSVWFGIGTRQGGAGAIVVVPIPTDTSAPGVFELDTSLAALLFNRDVSLF